MVFFNTRIGYIYKFQIFLMFQMFEKCGKVASVTIARKKDPKKPGSLLSMGYGFVEFKRKESADEAVKTLQVLLFVLCFLTDGQLKRKKGGKCILTRRQRAKTLRNRIVLLFQLNYDTIGLTNLSCTMSYKIRLN